MTIKIKTFALFLLLTFIKNSTVDLREFYQEQEDVNAQGTLPERTNSQTDSLKLEDLKSKEEKLKEERAKEILREAMRKWHKRN